MSISTGFVIADFDSSKNNGKANQQNQLNSCDIRVCSRYFAHMLFIGILILLLCLRTLKPHWLFYDI